MPLHLKNGFNQPKLIEFIVKSNPALQRNFSVNVVNVFIFQRLFPHSGVRFERHQTQSGSVSSFFSVIWFKKSAILI